MTDFEMLLIECERNTFRLGELARQNGTKCDDDEHESPHAHPAHLPEDPSSDPSSKYLDCAHCTFEEVLNHFNDRSSKLLIRTEKINDRLEKMIST